MALLLIRSRLQKLLHCCCCLQVKNASMCGVVVLCTGAGVSAKLLKLSQQQVSHKYGPPPVQPPRQPLIYPSDKGQKIPAEL